MQSSNQTPDERTPAAVRPAGARLLAYLGTGAGIALLPGGMALVVMAEHLDEVVRLSDFCASAQRRPAAA
jgi:hypothetical protein